MENMRIKFYIEKDSFWAHAASLLLAMATVFQLIACWGLWNDRSTVLMQLLLPLASYLLFVLVLNLLGKSALWLTSLPFLGGVAFHGLQAWNAENKLVMVIGITYCVLAAVLYLATVFSLIRTKWLLFPLFALPFAYRAFYRDVLLLQDLENPVHFAAGMREMSLLCVLLAMTLLALGMKKLLKERRRKAAKVEAPEESAPAAPTAPVAPVAPAAPAAPVAPVTPVVIPPAPVDSPFAVAAVEEPAAPQAPEAESGEAENGES